MPSKIATKSAVVFVLILAASGRQLMAENQPCLSQGLAPRETIEGLVSIPGSPLPAMPKEWLRDSIPPVEALLAGVRLFGRTTALARGVGFQATLYFAIGEYAKSEQLFGEAETILKERGSPGLELGWLHNNRGLGYLQQGRHGDAIQSFQAALTAMKPDDPELIDPRARAMQNLASAFHLLGDVDNAESGYLQSLGLLRRLKVVPKGTEQRVRANLANLYSSIGSNAESRKILEDLASQKGLERTVRFAVLNNLGHVLNRLKDAKGAEARLKEARELTAARSGWRLLVMTNLSVVYFEAKEFESARRVGESALRLADELCGVDSAESAALTATLGTTAFAQGELPKAERLLTEARKVLSKEAGREEAIAGITRMLAFVAQKQGQSENAIELSHQALELDKKNLERILAFGSEAQRLAYRLKESPYDQLANLGDATLLGEAVLAMKGAVLESLLAERALARKSDSPEDQKRLHRIHSLKVALMEKTARGDADTEGLERSLKEQETDLAKRLAVPAFQRRSRMDLPHVRAALESDQVLIEIIRFDHYDGSGQLTPWYGGVIIPRSGNLAWVTLGPASDLEGLVSALLGQLDVGNRGFEGSDGKGGDVVSRLQALHEHIWTPLERALPKEARRILLSPDGAMHFIPWAVLLDDKEQFLAERWSITQVGSGRDLTRVSGTRSDKTLLALADGKGDLPYSRTEVENLARSAKSHGWRSTILIGRNVSESALSRHQRPRILHFATHGGERNTDQDEAIQKRLGSNPMYRGFLLLGGNSHGQGLGDDGILTAEEAAGLELEDTWLTVLSACRTGAGDARIGEGVLGLRRGFTLAGTENLIFSLWSVDDEATAGFMEAFYERLFVSGNVAESFRITQIEELRLWKKASGIPEAVFRAGGFILTK